MTSEVALYLILIVGAVSMLIEPAGCVGAPAVWRRRRAVRRLARLELGFRVQGSEFRVQGSGFRFQGSGFRVQGSGFRVRGEGTG